MRLSPPAIVFVFASLIAGLATQPAGKHSVRPTVAK